MLRIPEAITTRLLKEQLDICERVDAICYRYSFSKREEWMAGVLICTLESYWRVCKTIMALGGNSEEGFVNAHFREPLLPVGIMEIAARDMQKLKIEDSMELIAYSETVACYPDTSLPKNHREKSEDTIESLIIVLTKRLGAGVQHVSPGFSSEWRRTSRIDQDRVCSMHLGLSSIGKNQNIASKRDSGRLLFTTLGTHSIFLGNDPVLHPEAVVFFSGNGNNGCYSPYDVGRGRWRLEVNFSVFNNSEDTYVIYDVYAKVYNRLKELRVLASVAHNMAVQLQIDNSILGEGKSTNLDTNDSLNVKLTLEASIFESLKTTIVFGLHVKYYEIDKNSIVHRTLPSDALFVFQHSREMGRQCHFVSRTAEQIKKRLRDEPSNPDVQEFCRSLLNIFEQHTATS